MVGAEIPVDDPDAYYRRMAMTFVEEYLMMGWDEEAIFRLFQDPFYQAPHLVYRHRGEDYVKTLIQGVRNG